MHDNTACKFHYRRDLMISAIRCGEKINISVSDSIIGHMSCKILACWILAKNPISCIHVTELCGFLSLTPVTKLVSVPEKWLLFKSCLELPAKLEQCGSNMFFIYS